MAHTGHQPGDTTSGRIDRRAFVRNGAIATGAAWVIPAVVTTASASAQANGTNAPCAFTVDGFDFGGQELGNGQSSEVAGSMIVGGFRDSFVETTSGGTGLFDATLSIDASGSNRLVFGTQNDQRGRALITWDGNDGDPIGVDTAGLGSQDLEAVNGPGGSLRINFIRMDIAGTAELTFRVWSAAGAGFSELTIAQAGPVLSPFIVEFPYSSFIGSADFSDVSAVQFELETLVNDADIIIDFLGADCPTVV